MPLTTIAVEKEHSLDQDCRMFELNAATNAPPTFSEGFQQAERTVSECIVEDNMRVTHIFYHALFYIYSQAIISSIPLDFFLF